MHCKMSPVPSEQWNKDMFKTYDSFLQTLQTTDFSEKYVKKLLIPYRRYVRNSKGCKKLQQILQENEIKCSSFNCLSLQSCPFIVIAQGKDFSRILFTML